MKTKCEICGGIEIDTHFEGCSSEIAVPVEMSKTIEDLRKYVEEYMGGSYEKITVNKLEESFEKRMETPSHLSWEDRGYDEAMLHTLEPIECWVECL